MNNLSLIQLFERNRRDRGKWMRRAQTLLGWVGAPWVLRLAMDPTQEMSNLEVLQNLWHFAMQTLAYGVPGDFAAFGCFDGKTAVVYQKVLEAFGATRSLHLYDHFQTAFHLGGVDIRAEVERNFQLASVGPPIIHEGDFRSTIPASLPKEIACMDIDCGTGGDPGVHEVTVLYLLEHIYPRMSPGSIGILMDYYEEGVTPCPNYNQGVGLACRKFFADKPERVYSLWADEYPLGYFRKQR